ncbi:phage protein GemA/Gp16 family protein [Thaumasiovibrio sp. DFM-14]|uniref:phage protein GemA/Gp16 family protein n=1 Tax=Thaumasiovibrio sp. DFM-14 TaxID=3384792 RepID=UPI0039A35D1B
MGEARRYGGYSCGGVDIAEIDKIRALWISMHKNGIVCDSSETALNKFVKRMTGVENVGWLDKGQASVVIEGLKSWTYR